MEAPTRSAPGRAGVSEWHAASLYVVEHEGMMQLQMGDGAVHGVDIGAGAGAGAGGAEAGPAPVPVMRTDSQDSYASLPDTPSALDSMRDTLSADEGIRLRDGSAVRAVVLNEAPRAKSLCVTLERTLSANRGVHVPTRSSCEWCLPIEQRDGESPLALSRRLYAASKADASLAGRTASLLASSTSPLLCAALDCYVERFHFEESPVDMALRGLLALEHLPAEAQQIDRIVAAFARRYAACNPGVLTSDEAYMLAFSLIMLHTATFNRNSKARMSRAEYAALAGTTGLEHELLDYYYDNTTLVEFAYARNDGDGYGSHGAFSLTRESPGTERAALYKLIALGRVHELRLRFAALDLLESPFACALHDPYAGVVRQRLVHLPTLEVRISQKPPRRALWHTRPAADEYTLLVRVCMLGTVQRREMQTARSLISYSAPRWRQYGLVVTGSALLWFRDPSVVQLLRDLLSRKIDTLLLRPDDVTPLDEAFCVREVGDEAALRIRAQQRWQVVIPVDGTDAEWMAAINYIASLCSCCLSWDDAACLVGTAGDISASVLPHKAHPAPLTRIDTLRLSESSASPTRPRALHLRASSLPDSPSMRRKSSAPSLAALEGDTRMLLSAALHDVNYYISSNTKRAVQLGEHLNRKLRLARHLCLITPLQRSTRDHFDALARQVHRELRAAQYEFAYLESRLDALHIELSELQSELQLYS